MAGPSILLVFKGVSDSTESNNCVFWLFGPFDIDVFLVFLFRIASVDDLRFKDSFCLPRTDRFSSFGREM